MRLFETLSILLLAVVACMLVLRPARRSRGTAWLSLVAGVSITLHLGLEGSRWQMIPAYVLAMVFLVVALRGIWTAPDAARDGTAKRPWLRRVGAGLSLLLAGVTVAGTTLLPVFNLSVPSGPFAVGTTKLHLVDSSRTEVLTEQPDDRRELVVRMWYPAHVPDPTTGEQASYISPAVAAAYARKYGLPSFATSHLDLVETYAYQEAPLAESQDVYPVLLFSHGYNVPPALYTSFLADIASQGYIVASVNHTYESTAAVFPDGRVAHFNHTFVQKTYTSEMWERIGALEQQYRQRQGPERLATLREINRTYPNSSMMRRWATDLSFVIDELERLHAEAPVSPFYQRLDLARIGAFGHSAGGAASGQLLLADDRVRAGANWDGAQWGDAIDSTFAQPFLMVYADRDSTAFNPNPLIYRQGSESVFYDLTIRGTDHSNFSDIPRLIPLRAVNQAGPIAPTRAANIATVYTLAFFDKHLKGEIATLLEDSSAGFSEATFSARRTGGEAPPQE